MILSFFSCENICCCSQNMFVWCVFDCRRRCCFPFNTCIHTQIPVAFAAEKWDYKSGNDEGTQYFPPNTYFSRQKESDVAVISLFHRKPPVAIKSHSTLPHPRESFPDRWLFVENSKKQWRSFLGCERERKAFFFLSSSSNPFSFILPEAHFRAGEGKNADAV